VVVVAKEYAVFFVYRAFVQRALSFFPHEKKTKKHCLVWRLISPAVAVADYFFSFWKVDDAVAAARPGQVLRLIMASLIEGPDKLFFLVAQEKKSWENVRCCAGHTISLSGSLRQLLCKKEKVQSAKKQNTNPLQQNVSWLTSEQRRRITIESQRRWSRERERKKNNNKE
jgi:hypothetical protein